MMERDLPLLVSFDGSDRSTMNLESWTIDTGYLTSTDGFEFELFDEPGLMRDLAMQPVTLTLDGKQQLVGRIEITEVGRRGTGVTCRGRDYLADLVECNVDPTFKLRDEMTLETAIGLVCNPVGITEVLDDADFDDAKGRKLTIRDLRSGVQRPRSTKRRKRKSDPLRDYQPRPGEGIYEYCHRLLARLGLTLQPGEKRHQVILTSPRYDEQPRYTIRRYREPTLNTGNNVIDATATRDYTRVPSFALFTGTAAKAGKPGQYISMPVDVYAFAGITINGQSANGGSREALDVMGRHFQNARVRPGEIEHKPDALRPLYRLLYFRDDEARSQEQLACAATRAIAERLKDTLAYRVTLRGHTDPETGAIWTVDTMVNVQDEICGVNEPLWIAKRTLRFSPTEGSTTQLECWRPGSFPFIEEVE